VQEAPLKELVFDLKNSSCWEYVLIDEKKEEDGDGGNAFDVVEESAAETEVAPEDAADDRDILDCPMSWASRIVVPRKTFMEAFPHGRKHTHYKKATVEKYCDYHAGMSGLVLRVTLFQVTLL
jgi:hypothetical protein